jgi:hypothetical protein
MIHKKALAGFILSARKQIAPTRHVPRDFPLLSKQTVMAVSGVVRLHAYRNRRRGRTSPFTDQFVVAVASAAFCGAAARALFVSCLC